MRAVTGLLAMGLGALAGACATGDTGTGGTDGPGGGDPDAADVDGAATDAGDLDGADPDAQVIDAQVIDAQVIDAQVIDARPIDAPPPIDATPIDAPCTPVVTQRLLNPAFDGAPIGTGWTQNAFDPNYPLITAADGIPEHSAPNKAWLGGILGGTDSMFQDVAIPAGTTMLVVRGQYEVRTGETDAVVYDRGFVELTSTAGVVLEQVLAVTDNTGTAAWTPFMRQFSTPYAGQTVRLRFTASNDPFAATSFYFDSLTLETTGCP